MIIKSRLTPTDVPWDIINTDCDIAVDVPPLIYGEFLEDSVSTIQLIKRRDLDNWATDYRNHVTELISPLFWSNATYESITDASWFARYNKGGYVDWHIHKPYVDLIAVWYLKADDASDFVYMDNGVEQTIKVSTGDILIFPGSVLHRTIPQHSNVERIIMSSDLCLTRHSVEKLVKLSNSGTEQLDKLYATRQQYLIDKIKEYNEIKSSQVFN